MCYRYDELNPLAVAWQNGLPGPCGVNLCWTGVMILEYPVLLEERANILLVLHLATNYSNFFHAIAKEMLFFKLLVPLISLM